jgi:hypothetical protein
VAYPRGEVQEEVAQLSEEKELFIKSFRTCEDWSELKEQWHQFCKWVTSFELQLYSATNMAVISSVDHWPKQTDSSELDSWRRLIVHRVMNLEIPQQ